MASSVKQTHADKLCDDLLYNACRVRPDDNEELKFLHDNEFCCAGVFLQQLVQPDLTVGLKVTQNVNVDIPLLHSSITSVLIGQSWADLGLVEHQFVVGDPPRFLGLQPLCSLLLHVILLQPVRLDQLLKTELTVKIQTEISFTATLSVII